MFLLFIFCPSVLSEFQKDRTYSVSVKSKYLDAQILDHFVYFLSDFSINTTNTFLNYVLPQKSINDRESLVSTLANLNLISSSSLSLLESYIDLNYYLPRCEMYRSIAFDVTENSKELINDPGFFLASKTNIENVDNFFLTNITQVFDFDFYIKGYDSTKETVFIYADLTKAKSSEFILNLINQKNNEFDKFNLLLRPISYSGSPANLRGFGVEMRPYNYLMDNDNNDSPEKVKHSIQKESRKEDNTTKYVDFEVDSDYMNYSEISFFGSKFTKFISDESNGQDLIELLRDVSNNWPVYLRKISEVEPTLESNKELEKVASFSEKSNEKNRQVGPENGRIYSVSSLNGRVLNINNFDAFTFIEDMQEEQTFSDILKDEFSVTDVMFTESFSLNDDYLLDYRTKYAVWEKDYENDAAYKDWSTSIKSILRLKKNILNIIIYLDPTNPHHLSELYTLFLISQPEKFTKQKSDMRLPLRIGIIPYFNLASKASRRISFAFAHLSLHSQNDAYMFLIQAFAIWKNKQAKGKGSSVLREEYFIESYRFIKGSYKIEWNELHKLYSCRSEEYNFIKEANKYIKHCGAQLGSIRLNGLPISLDKSVNDLFNQIQQMFLSISKLCLKFKVFDLANVDIVDLLSNEYLVVKSINSGVSDANIDGTGVFKMKYKMQKLFVDAFRDIEWFYKDDENPRSHFILFTPVNSTNETNINIEVDKQDENKEDNIDDIDENEEYDGIDENESKNEINVATTVDENTKEIDLFKEFAKNSKHSRSTAFAINPSSFRKIVGIGENETALIVNGRVYHSFEIQSINQLNLIDIWSERFILTYIDQVINQSIAMKPISEEEKEEEYQRFPFDALSYLSSVVVDWRKYTIQRVDVQSIIKGMNGIESCPLYYNNHKSGKIEWVLIVDPLSLNFQRIIDFVNYITNVRDVVSLQMIIVPPPEISPEQQDLHLNSFYRYSLNSDEVIFSMLDDTTSYSTIIDSPQTWLLEQLKTSEGIDVDNVQLKDKDTNSEASFLLSSMIIEGKCFIKDIDYPRYVELGLFTKKTKKNNFKSVKVDETTVMPFNSYFQFKADPGLYRVVFSSNNSASLYTFDTEQYRNQEYPLYDNIHLCAFSHREPVMQANIRAPNFDSYKSSLQNRIEYLKTESKLSNKTKSQINIFTIASGKLYERLSKIMILSVRENTNSNINFFLIKSFLSPAFKASLPEMAKKYSFRYQFVDYKWPSWLTKQREKQRFIWANKILFLDLLFPNNIDKIIYVDADQIVRCDLQELMDIDITVDGAPYAFVPFCDSRPEIEPYRFWKRGYWKDILTKEDQNKQPQNKATLVDQNEQEIKHSSYKYHISALFAIDMVKFKEINAGDQLRIKYQQLAADKNSLANLDQDLPNSMQNQIPIYSLDQNWLWCETWCSDDDMEKAKTIDLCNNPMTKINKVEIAKERIEEWPRFDEEAEKTEDNFSSGDYEYVVFH